MNWKCVYGRPAISIKKDAGYTVCELHQDSQILHRKFGKNFSAN